MSKNNIKCKLVEEELKTFWPQWHAVRCLGGGAFGDVFEIYRDNFGIREKAALKMIQTSDVTETYAMFSPSGEAALHAQKEQAEIPEVFRNEIQIMEALKGAPNIVAIEDFHLKRDESATILFVRMELLTSFQWVMKERQRNQSWFTIPEVLKVGRDICTALMYCETKGIIHRDIKPANLFIDGFGDYKVGDFGVSKRMDTVHVAFTMTGIGTISYVAPEVYNGRSYNNTVDIYALGLILYQLLNCGRIPFLPKTGPFNARDIDIANNRRLQGEPLPSLKGNMVGSETVDDSLDAMIRKACALRSEDRYQSAKEFYKKLTEWGARQENISREDRSKAKQEQDKQEQDNISREDIPQEKQHQEDKQSQKKQQEDILQSRNHLQPEKHKQGDALELDIEQNRTTPFSFVEDIQDEEKEPSQNSIHEPQDEMEPEENASDDEQAHSPGPESDEEESGHGQKKIKPGIVIAIIMSVAAVLIFCIAIKILRDPQQKNRMIFDSWEKIIAAGENGSYAKKYHIGDTKVLDLGEEGEICMELVAMDADELADGSGKAHMTWIAKDLLNTEHCINKDNKSYNYEWEKSDMRAWLQESILPLFPDDVRSNIKEVTKYSFDRDLKTIPSTDTIWIPSYREVFVGAYNEEDNGPDYASVFSNNESRVKYKTGTSSTSGWWLRSAYGHSQYTMVSWEGDIHYVDSAAEYGVAIGFCL